MATRGGQPGNRNPAKGKEWFDALRKVCVQRKTLDKAALVVAKAAEEGEQWAISEIANRFDGKPAQAVELSGPDGNAIQVESTDPVALEKRLRDLQAQLDAMQ